MRESRRENTCRGAGWAVTSALLLAAAAGHSAMEQGKVLAVESPDTFRIQLGEREESVRLVGVDAPDLASPNHPAECKAAEAHALTRLLIDHRFVSLEPDPALPARDPQGRLLRYVYVLPGPRDVAAELLERGYAHTWAPSRFRELEAYWRLERLARSQGVGIWDESCAGQQAERMAPELPSRLTPDAAQRIRELEARNRAEHGITTEEGPVEDPCCVLCAGSTACGDTCIPEGEKCTEPPGCACAAEEL